MTWVTVKSRGTEDCTQAMECCNLAEIRISSEVEKQQQFFYLGPRREIFKCFK